MRLLIAFACLLIAAAVLFSCNGEKIKVENATLSGRVTEADTSIYLAGVRVFETSHGKNEAITDSAGYFKLEGVAFEEHNIYFEKQGYETYTLWFEYTGNLKNPMVTEHIIMDKTDETEGTVEIGDEDEGGKHEKGDDDAGGGDDKDND